MAVRLYCYRHLSLLVVITNKWLTTFKIKVCAHRCLKMKPALSIETTVD